jgi:glyoxylase-like metal-dependent hydrolase (beta-lactamase superfamily II)
VNVERLNVGWFMSAAGIWRRGDDMEERVRFPVPAYLITDDEHRILVDTGLNPNAVADPVAHYEDQALSMFTFEQDASVADQVDLDSLTGLVMTHLHFDHAGGLELIPDSVPIYLQRKEWEATQDKVAKERNFFHPRDYAPIEGRVTLVDGDHDLLGDGSIELLATPGHTPGHQSVRVGDSLIIGGDVSHYASGLDDHRFPLFADDHKAQAASAERLKALRDEGFEVTPGHDPELLG